MKGFTNQIFSLAVVGCMIILLIPTSAARAIDLQSLAVSYVQNYSKSEYLFGNQNWGITSDANNVMYFANTEGLLSFDGARWHRYLSPNDQIVRSVAASPDGRIYAGLFADFGYWSYNKNRRFVYTSLSHLLPSNIKLTEEIWKIYVEKDRVIFQSFSSIFIYQSNKIHVVNNGTPYLFLLKGGDRYFVKSINGALYELLGSSLKYVVGSEIIFKSNVLCVIPFRKGSYLIGTARDGLFLYDGKVITPWKTHADDYFKTSQLNCGIALHDRQYAFGTIQNGIVILDEQGRIVRKINKSSGLQNNTVLGLYQDRQYNLWLALDNGIDRIELNSPLSFFFDKSGVLGSVYAAAINNNRVYLGTNHGLFYRDLQATSEQGVIPKIHFVEGSQGQVWDLQVFDGTLFCGHNDGTYIVKSNSFEKISQASGGWSLRPLGDKAGSLIQGVYNGLVVYRKSNSGIWMPGESVNGFGQASRYVEVDSRGYIWTSHPSRGLYRLKLNNTQSRVLSTAYYNQSHGLPHSDRVNVFSLEDRLVYTTKQGIYIYDAINDNFSNYQHLNERLGSFAMSDRIEKASEHSYWFFSKDRTSLVTFGEKGKIAVDSTSLYGVSGRMIRSYEDILQLNQSMFLVALEDGYALFNSAKRRELSLSSSAIPSVLIQRIEDITRNVNLLVEQPGKSDLSLPYSQNNVRIHFALPYYTQRSILYQYFLEGYSTDWSELSAQNVKDFTNLSSGKYTFKVRALINRELFSEVSSFDFEIQPPWYLSIWSILGVIILHIVALVTLRRIYLKKLEVHRRLISEKVYREREEQLRKDIAEREQQRVLEKNERLEADLAGKSRELTNLTMNVVYKNELLQKIKGELLDLKDSKGNKLSEDQLKRILKVIEDAATDERDWNVFEVSFNETHENFFKKLKARFPELVPNDLKLCAYLRMNMNSKEIAGLLNITLRGVEIRRYRLRKKLNLDQSQNLTEFLIQL